MFMIAYTAHCRPLLFSRYATCCTQRRPSLQLGCGMYRYSQEQVTADCSRLPVLYVCVKDKDPCRFSWTQELMRKHLTACLSNQWMSLFPGKSRKVFAKIKSSIHFPVFCSCRMPENKMGMVQCTRCEEWFHKKCKNIPRAVFKKSIATWFCNECL